MILIIEDIIDDYRYLHLFNGLNNSNITYKIASTPAQAYKLLEMYQTINFIIIDIRLYEKINFIEEHNKGFEVIKYINQNYHDKNIIILTDRDEIADTYFIINKYFECLRHSETNNIFCIRSELTKNKEINNLNKFEDLIRIYTEATINQIINNLQSTDICNIYQKKDLSNTQIISEIINLINIIEG